MKAGSITQEMIANEWNEIKFPGSRHNSLVAAEFIGNQSKCGRCYYSKAITLCSQHLIYSDTLKVNLVYAGQSHDINV